MTFCFFSAQYLPTVGGVERFTHNLAAQIVKTGHKAVVVTSALENLPHEETVDGVKIIRVPSLHFMNGRMPVALCSKKWSNAKQKLLQYNIDFIVIQTRFYPLCLLGAKFAKKHNIPSIVIEHGTAHLMRGGISGTLGNIYEHVFIKLIKHYSKDFYGVSKACCQWLMHFNIKSDKVLHNAVDKTQLLNIANNTKLQCENLFEEGHVNIVFSGRFIKEKGVIPLLKAFEKVKEKGQNASLFLAGNGPLFEQAKQVLPSGAHLLGMLSYEQNIALVKKADIYCLPTFSEGFSTSVLEAAALNTVIITTKTGGSPELILNEDYGILIKDMSENEIEKALLYAIDNENWRKKATKNAERILEQNFTWEIIAQKLLIIAKSYQ